MPIVSQQPTQSEDTNSSLFQNCTLKKLKKKYLKGCKNEIRRRFFFFLSHFSVFQENKNPIMMIYGSVWSKKNKKSKENKKKSTPNRELEEKISEIVLRKDIKQHQQCILLLQGKKDEIKGTNGVVKNIIKKKKMCSFWMLYSLCLL